MAKLSVEHALAKAKSHRKKGEVAEAQSIYISTLEASPKNNEAQESLTVLGCDQRPAVGQRPPQAVIDQLMELYSQGQFEAVSQQAKSLISQFPRTVVLWNILGATSAQIGMLEEAIFAFRNAIGINPSDPKPHNDLGNALVDQGQLGEAIESFSKALAIKPDYADAQHNMSYACLSVKDFEQGFEKQEWRWKTKQLKTGYLKTKKPMWNGEASQRVLVWAEKCIGDEIMLSSIMPEIYAASLKILVKCDKRLIPLFERSFPNDITYYSRDTHVPEDEYDFHIPMGSLPLTFRKSLDSFKTTASGFLKGDMAKAESIKGQLVHDPGKKLVGISWKTNSQLRNSSARNIDLADLARALDHSNTQLLCLQYGDVSDEIEALKADFGIDVIQFGEVDNMYDIDGLAALILACDEIVSTTNVTVHLAGALGAKVTALLPFSPRWIWGDGSESFFYESVIPLKQEHHNNWSNVLDTLRSNNSSLF